VAKLKEKICELQMKFQEKQSFYNLRLKFFVSLQNVSIINQTFWYE